MKVTMDEVIPFIFNYIIVKIFGIRKMIFVSNVQKESFDDV